jgi:hypothetical protein
MSDVIAENRGCRGEYHWLETWGYPLAVRQVVREIPEIVLGKQVVVTVSDSGLPELTEEEAGLGWTMQQQYAVSPVVGDVRILPSTDIYDEWYVFNVVPALGTMRVFVTNAYTFFLSEKRAAMTNSIILHEEFWKHLEILHPDSYLACNENAFMYVCRDAELFGQVAGICHKLISGMKSIFPDG